MSNVPALSYRMVEPLPFKHQMRGVRLLAESQGKLALLCDPGTGKSRMVIDYLGLLASCGQGEVRVLILCPKSVKDSWLKEFEKWLGPDVGYYAEVLQGTIPQKCDSMSAGLITKAPKHGISAYREGDGRMIRAAILNVEALSSRRARNTSTLDSDRILKAVKKFAPHVLVCDESHRLRTASSNAGRLAARIAKTVDKRILLTGTPMPHSPLDVWGQWRILDPNVFADHMPSGFVQQWSFTRFKEYYSVLDYFGQPAGFQRLDDMEKRMQPSSYVVKKEECLDLPPVTMVDVPFELSPAEKTAYRVMKRDLQVMLSDGSQMTSVNKLSQMMRLRQITCGFITDDSGRQVEIGTSRLDQTMGLLEDIMSSEDRCVIFAWSRWECEKLADRITKSKDLYGAKVQLITGDTPEEERLAMRNLFGSDSKEKLILVAQSRTISLGVNELTTACYGIFLSLTQQRDDLIQGIARLDRQGQTRPVTLYFVVGEDTIDEVVLQSHRDRTNLENSLLEHLKED